MDHHNPNHDHLWLPCPTGMIQKVADQPEGTLRNQDSVAKNGLPNRRGMLMTAAAVAVSAGVGTIAYRSLFAPVDPRALGGLTCSQCREHLQKYIDKTIEDRTLIAQIDEHLKLCPKCSAKYNMMQTV